MAAPSQTSYNSSTGNGVTTVFPYTFKILQEADLQVLVDGVEQTLTTHYTISGVGVDGGGNVTFVTAPANGTTVVRRRDMALERTGTDYQYQGEIPADVLNDDQDAPILMLQQLQEQINRALRLPAGETAAEFGAASVRKNLVPMFNTTTGALELSDFTATQIRDMIANGYGSGALGVSGYIATLLDDADAAAARTTLAAAGSGAVTASGLTMTTARVLGRTTAGTGAPEELTAANVAAFTAAASTSAQGAVELATTAEAQAGTDTQRAVTPAALQGAKLISMTMQASTSGSSVPFSSIPSWVKRITIMFSGVSLSGSDNLLVQIGDSGGLETSGYTCSGGGIQNAGASFTATSTSGFLIALGAGAGTLFGTLTLTLMDSATNLWASSHTATRGDVAVPLFGGGTKALSAVLDRLSIVPTGANTFDAGSINVLYE